MEAKLLAWDNGGKYGKWVVIFLIGGIAYSIFWIFVIRNLSVTNIMGRNTAMIIFLWVIIMITWSLTVYLVYLYSARSNTKVYVYDCGAMGTGMTSNLSSPQEFRLYFNQITHIDFVKKDAIVLYAQHAKYTVHCRNPSHMHRLISEGIQSAATGEPMPTAQALSNWNCAGCKRENPPTANNCVFCGIAKHYYS
ncbi:MAG: hypothetical protein LBE55_03145 [Clostridiales bacterium]|jgi:hypothetical protein|nr:hypothetical protein [Clostridiales bacterium]